MPDDDSDSELEITEIGGPHSDIDDDNDIYDDDNQDEDRTERDNGDAVSETADPDLDRVLNSDDDG